MSGPLYGDPVLIEEAMRAIRAGFAWDATPQGADYWIDVHANLSRVQAEICQVLKKAGGK